MNKYEILDEELGELLQGEMISDIPEVNLDTTTEAGRKWRQYMLSVKDYKKMIKNMKAKYERTKDKGLGYQIARLTGEDYNYNPYFDERG